MEFDNYIVALFKGLDGCGKSDEEKLEIIKDVFTALGSDYKEEEDKFDKMQAEGNDMVTVANVFGKLMVSVMNQAGVDDFDAMKLFPQVVNVDKDPKHSLGEEADRIIQGYNDGKGIIELGKEFKVPDVIISNIIRSAKQKGLIPNG